MNCLKKIDKTEYIRSDLIDLNDLEAYLQKGDH